MIKRIATGMFAFAAMLAVFAGSAQAEPPEDGLYDIINRTEVGVMVLEARLQKVGTTEEGAGIFVIHSGIGDKAGFLSAESSDNGSKVDLVGPNKTHWILIQNSNGWSLHHKSNGANCLSTQSGYSLRRAKGNKDQLFELKKK